MLNLVFEARPGYHCLCDFLVAYVSGLAEMWNLEMAFACWGTLSQSKLSLTKGSRISIGDHTFINYGVSITAHQQVEIGRHCLLGQHLRIMDRNEHGLEQREVRLRPN